MSYDERLSRYMTDAGIDQGIAVDQNGNPIELYKLGSRGEEMPATRESILGSNTRANQILNGDPYRRRDITVGEYMSRPYQDIIKNGNGRNFIERLNNAGVLYDSRTNIPQMQQLEQMGQQWQREKSLDDMLRQIFANEGVYD